MKSSFNKITDQQNLVPLLTKIAVSRINKTKTKKTNHFYGPFHKNHVKDLKEKKGVLPGVYIWGFVYDSKNGRLLDPIDFTDENVPTYQLDGIELKSNWKFIPYYVGIDSHMINFIRLGQHSKLSGATMKYTRFHKTYMTEFFKGRNGFPIHYFRDKNYTKHVNDFISGKFPKKTVSFFNDDSTLKVIYPNPEFSLVIPQNNSGRKHWPINKILVDGNPIPDTLEQLIRYKNNFFFCYAEVDNPENIKDLEACTYWSLKGLTISEIKKNPVPINITFEITCSSIFQKNQSGDIIMNINNNLKAAPCFPGDY